MEKPKEDDGWLYDEYYRREPEERQAARQLAEADSDFDYFATVLPKKPKEAIGRYVRSHGFNVPLIEDQSEWRKAIDDGSAMLRSELAQDYDGLSGLLSSAKISHEWYETTMRGRYYDTYDECQPEFMDEIYSLMRAGLRSGELSPVGFMNLLSWNRCESYFGQTMSSYGLRFAVNWQSRQASTWRFIEGTNVRILADPNVAGRYHLGVQSTPKPGGYRSPEIYPGPGYYRVEADEHDKPKSFRKHRQDFVAKACIELYEAIRELTFFSAAVAPLMELQIDEAGEIHFLQYLKTKLVVDYVEAFKLPEGEGVTEFNNVRGITPEEGWETRLFFPNLSHLRQADFLRKIADKAILYDHLKLNNGNRLVQQLLAAEAALILSTTYISFQDNHFDSAPLYRTQLALGYDNMEPGAKLSENERLKEVLETYHKSHAGMFDESATPITYADIKVTANGRHATIESDWDLKTADWEDI